MVVHVSFFVVARVGVVCHLTRGYKLLHAQAVAFGREFHRFFIAQVGFGQRFIAYFEVSQVRNARVQICVHTKTKNETKI